MYSGSFDVPDEFSWFFSSFVALVKCKFVSFKIIIDKIIPESDS